MSTASNAIELVKLVVGRYNPVAVVEEAGTEAQAIKTLYAAYQRADGRAKASAEDRRTVGLALGKALCDMQKDCVSLRQGFRDALKELAIPHATAYRWIKKYELSVGIKPVPVVASADEEDEEPDPRDTRATANCMTGLKIHLGSTCSLMDRLDLAHKHWNVTPEHIARLRNEVVRVQKRAKVLLAVIDALPVPNAPESVISTIN
jgi:hypothetical protein